MSLYAFILPLCVSTLPNAKKLQDWACSHVFPEIRRTGSYVGAAHALPGNYIEAVERLLGELKTNAILIEDKTRPEQAVAVQQPKVDVYDAITKAEYTFGMREAGKFVGMSGSNPVVPCRRSL